MRGLHGQFVDIFEEHIKPLIVSNLGNDEQARSLLYTIELGRNRFRAGLAYLLSGQRQTGILIGASSEVAWAAILILDDIGDNTFIRRGRESAWRKFGLLETSHAATLGFIISKRILERGRLGGYLIQDLERSIEFTLRGQIEQKVFSCYNTSIETLLDSYDRKTALGRWPVSASIRVNGDVSIQTKVKIERFSRAIAIVAQIRNDLDDISINPREEKYEPSMKDLQERTLSYPVVLFFNVASANDKARFLNECWERDTMKQQASAERAMEMFTKYNIFEQCEIEINKRALSALALIQDVPQPYGELLESWAEGYCIQQRNY